MPREELLWESGSRQGSGGLRELNSRAQNALLDMEGRLDSASETHRPGRARPAQAWPGLAYGGVEKARPIGRRLLWTGLGRPRPAYRLELNIVGRKIHSLYSEKV